MEILDESTWGANGRNYHTRPGRAGQGRAAPSGSWRGGAAAVLGLYVPLPLLAGWLALRRGVWDVGDSCRRGGGTEEEGAREEEAFGAICEGEMVAVGY